MTPTAATSGVRPGDTRRRLWLALKRAFTYTLPALWALFTFFCITWIVLASFKTNHELFGDVWALPTSIEYKNYVNAWSLSKLGPQFVNSLILVGSAVVLLTLISAPAAYVLSRKKFKGVGLLTSLFIAVGTLQPFGERAIDENAALGLHVAHNDIAEDAVMAAGAILALFDQRQIGILGL